MDLELFKAELARAIFGMTQQEAIDKGICIDCKRDPEPHIHTEAGKAEYQISGLCEDCFDKMFGEES